MNGNDLINYVLDGEHGDYKSAILILNQFCSDLLDENINCEFAKGLADELENFAIRNGRCPQCGERLTYKTQDNNQLEAWGLPVIEQSTKAVCPLCSFCWE